MKPLNTLLIAAFLLFSVSTSAAFQKFPPPSAGYSNNVMTNFQPFGNAFPDTDIGTLEGKAVAELVRRNILGGFPDGTFKGGEPVNRAQAAKILLLSRYSAIADQVNNGRFSDVPGSGEWYIKFVIKAAQRGIIQGHPNGTFKPNDGVNTIEFVTMIARTFHLEPNLPFEYADIPNDSWMAIYAGIAAKYNLFPGRSSGTLEPQRTLSRNEVAVALYQYFSNRPYPVEEHYKGFTLLSGKHTVVLSTSEGNIALEINADAAPIAATSFIEHAKAGYYNNLTFHRVIPDFMIQGGDPTGTGAGGDSVYGTDFEDEQNDLNMDRGVLAMANAGPNTNGSQFFIVQAHEGTPWLKGNHTIFGKVVDGMDVVDAIVSVDRDGMDKPLTDVTFSAEVQN